VKKIKTYEKNTISITKPWDAKVCDVWLPLDKLV
jgi:hypothetical protein